MKIVGCDLHAKQQTIAMVDTDSGEFIEKTILHEGNAVREFYASLPGPVAVGIDSSWIEAESFHRQVGVAWVISWRGLL
jgi:hypothetical protein